MLRLKPKEIAKLKLVDQPISVTIEIGDVVDNLRIENLIGKIPVPISMAAKYSPPVRHQEFRLFANFPLIPPARQPSYIHIEHIENQTAALNEMPVYAGKTGQLILDRNEMLKWPEGDGGKGKLTPQIKITHVTMHELNSVLYV